MTGFQVELFESCYSHHSSVVGIVGLSAEIISSLQSHEKYTIISIDNKSKRVPKIPLDKPAHRYKLQTFLISISTVKELKENLQHLKSSQWWNHMASFLIIDNSTSSTKGCSRAFKILLTAWKMNLLYAKFICHRESKGILIYSYNPYTNEAPIPWQLETSRGITEQHPWTLLVCSYQESQEICKALDFDQTKDLGGYKIRAGVIPRDIQNSFKPNITSITGLVGFIASYMFPALNSTTEIFVNETTSLLRKMIDRGVVDIVITNSWNRQNYTISPMTYPHMQTEVAVVTQHRGNLSQIEKLLHVIDHTSRYAVVIVCCITFIFFKFFLRKPITTPILTIVRLICNAAIPNPPKNLATRIYLTGLFIFVMTLQGIYQGQLASLLTKPVARPNVETFDDLENLKYTLYGHNQLIFDLKELNYSGPLAPLPGFSCVEYVLRNNSAACLQIRTRLVKISNKYDLHLSDAIIRNFRAFFIRDDWPLEQKWNILISRLVESHLIEHFRKMKVSLILKKQKFYEKEKDNQGPTVIRLKDLAFAFAVFGIGLAGATVVFFFEVLKGRKLLITTKKRG